MRQTTPGASAAVEASPAAMGSAEPFRPSKPTLFDMPVSNNGGRVGSSFSMHVEVHDGMQSLCSSCVSHFGPSRWH